MLPESYKNQETSYTFEYQITTSDIFIDVVLKDTVCMLKLVGKYSD